MSHREGEGLLNLSKQTAWTFCPLKIDFLNSSKPQLNSAEKLKNFVWPWKPRRKWLKLPAVIQDRRPPLPIISNRPWLLLRSEESKTIVGEIDWLPRCLSSIILPSAFNFAPNSEEPFWTKLWRHDFKFGGMAAYPALRDHCQKFKSSNTWASLPFSVQLLPHWLSIWAAMLGGHKKKQEIILTQWSRPPFPLLSTKFLHQTYLTLSNYA